MPNRIRRAATTSWILGDQLTPRASSLLAPDRCVVLMVESLRFAQRIPYHKQKLVLVWSAMRHFAGELRTAGYEVDYHEMAEDFETALDAHLRRYQPPVVRIMETAEYGVADGLAKLVRERGGEAAVTPNTMFLSDKAVFRQESEGKASRVMESFYRGLRRQTGMLMDDDAPTGGRWNFDRENRKPPRSGMAFPDVPRYRPDETTHALMRFVDQRFPGHFGQVEGFDWPVTRADAERFLEDFLDNRLDLFGPYQDAMVSGEPVLYHSLLSALLNIGLLEPMAVCRAAEARYRDGQARLHSVEGFIRQILGWREFVYQVYHWKMPGYTALNALNADIALPGFYWTAETDMFCVREAVTTLLARGQNHHIQRLMVTGNFALIAGLDPQQVNAWYWFAYIDAHEWVVSPNVLGMALYADRGVLGTKPYAASANYINRMSDYCARCAFAPKQRTGKTACPFNALYWDFLARNEDVLAGNPRMNQAYATMRRMDDSTLGSVRRHARDLRRRLRDGDRL